jgi:indolepyruvate ferredoxin oxidoreductase
VLITGIGGTGVVTVGQVLGMAAHLDGLSCSTLDVTGLAQKYGTVMSHIRLARSQSELHAPRIGHGEADAVIGCDLLATGSSEALRTVRAGHTSVIVATDPTPTAEFSRNPDWRQDSAALLRRIRAAAMLPVLELAPVQLAADLLGEPVAANMFMLGVAWQRGLLPVSLRSMQQAIDLNGVQKEGNQLAFSWGRRTGHDAAAVAALVDAPAGAVGAGVDEPLELMIERRERFLVDYQDAAMSGRYRALLNRVARAEALHNGGYAATRAAARSYFSLLAHKDGWEIARLYSSPEFRQELTATFEGDYRLRFHIGVWPFARRNPAGGPPLKGEVGPWLLSAFRVMAPLRFLRGTWLDPFARSAERRLNDRLLREFESDVDVALSLIAGGETDRAVQLLSLPQEIRGFGHVREAASREVARRRQVLLEKLAQRSATGYPGRPEHREKGHASS